MATLRTMSSAFMLLTSLVTIHYSAAELEIIPLAYLSGVTQNIQMTCRPPTGQDISKVVTMQLQREGLPVASYVTTSSPALEAVGVQFHVSVYGSYDAANPSAAFLGVTIPTPGEAARGNYSCLVDTLDSKGTLHHYKEQATLISFAANNMVPVFYQALLRELRIDLDTLTSDLGTLVTSQTAVDVTDSKAQTVLSAIDGDASRISTMLSDVNSVIQSTDQRVTSMRTALDRLRDVTPETPVNFYAYISGNYLSPAVGSNVVFDVVEQHTADNAYSRSTGIFTVPVNGTYFFRTATTDDTNMAAASLVVNDDVVASLEANDDYSLQQASACAVVEVVEGDQVKVVWRKGSKVYGYNPSSSVTHLSYFMGLLLW